MISGPRGLRAIKGFHDEALSGEWKRHRSSPRRSSRAAIPSRLGHGTRLAEAMDVAGRTFDPWDMVAIAPRLAVRRSDTAISANGIARKRCCRTKHCSRSRQSALRLNAGVEAVEKRLPSVDFWDVIARMQL